MKFNKIKTATVGKVAMTIAAGLLFSTLSQAAIVSADWQTAGDNLITRDTASGLDWLDITETTSMSYNSVLANSVFAGWRAASTAEVVNLWTNFGVDLSSTTTRVVPGFSDPGFTEAASFLGNTFPTFPDGVFAVTSEAGPTAGNQLYMFNHTDASGRAIYGRSEFGSNQSNAAIGTYLVQTSPVPVPAAVWLFGSGFMALVGIARRKKAA